MLGSKCASALLLLEVPVKPLCIRETAVCLRFASEHNKKDNHCYCGGDANAGLVRERLKELLNKNVGRK